MTPMEPKVIIATPMSYKTMTDGTDFFTGEEWFSHINSQDYQPLTKYILANDLTDEMFESISSNDAVIDRITLNNTPDVRTRRRKTDKTYERFATIRNMVLDYVLATDADYYVSVDSDVMIKPDCISRLVADMQERPNYGMIGAIVNNTCRKDMDRRFPTAIYNFGKIIAKQSAGNSIRMKPLCKFKRGAFIDVDYTGACMIINMKMLRDHPEVRWGPHKQGEDLYMCERIEKTTYKIGVNTDIITLHRMDNTLSTKHEDAFKRGDFV